MSKNGKNRDIDLPAQPLGPEVDAHPKTLAELTAAHRSAEQALNGLLADPNAPPMAKANIVVSLETIRWMLGYPSTFAPIAEKWKQADARSLVSLDGKPTAEDKPMPGPMLYFDSNGLSIDCRRALMLRVFVPWSQFDALREQGIQASMEAEKAAEGAPADLTREH